MQWEFIIALMAAIPILLFPVAFIWYMVIGGTYAAIKEAQGKRIALREGSEIVIKAY
ncbi:hypothetical protein ACFLYM_02355 [Chloroflexota bacterium]